MRRKQIEKAFYANHPVVVSVVNYMVESYGIPKYCRCLITDLEAFPNVEAVATVEVIGGTRGFVTYIRNIVGIVGRGNSDNIIRIAKSKKIVEQLKLEV